MEYDYTGKTWIDFGKKKQSNEWVTLRALKALKRVEDASSEKTRLSDPVSLSIAPGKTFPNTFIPFYAPSSFGGAVGP